MLTSGAREAGDAPIIDCHVHVIGDGIAHPYVANAAYRPQPAPLDDLIAIHDRCGIGRAVLVQASVHGSDNTLLLGALNRHPERFRGVAVVDPAPRAAVLDQLKDAGVMGLRLNLVHTGGPGEAALDSYGLLCREMGWRLQVYAEGATIAALATRLVRQDVPLVLDHFGGVSGDDPVARTVLSLVRDGAWVELSAPYRVSSQREEFEDALAFGRGLIEAAPDRCMWGSDWPHVAVRDTHDMSSLLSFSQRLVEAPAIREALLWKNAERFYEFKPVA